MENILSFQRQFRDLDMRTEETLLSSIKGKPVRDFIDRFPRLRVEWFPGDAPELKSLEFVWTEAKRRPFTNFNFSKRE
jgi:hypothetical protein